MLALVFRDLLEEFADPLAMDRLFDLMLPSVLYLLPASLARGKARRLLWLP